MSVDPSLLRGLEQLAAREIGPVAKVVQPKAVFKGVWVCAFCYKADCDNRCQQ